MYSVRCALYVVSMLHLPQLNIIYTALLTIIFKVMQLIYNYRM